MLILVVIGGAAGANIPTQDDQKHKVQNHDDLMKSAAAPAMPCHSANACAFAALAMWVRIWLQCGQSSRVI